MYSEPIRRVIQVLGSEEPRAFTTSEDVAAVVLCVTVGACQFVKKRDDSMFVLHEKNGWSREGIGVELTDRGRQAYLKTLKAA